MVQQDKLSVDKDKIGNTHDRESEMDHSKPEAASSSDQGPFSSDPFAANYRVIPDLNDPKFGATLKEFAFALTPKQVRFSQSVEWAERLRPFKQFDVILKVSRCSYSSLTGSLAVMDRPLNTSRSGICMRDICTSGSNKVLPMKRGLSVCKVSFAKRHRT